MSRPFDNTVSMNVCGLLTGPEKQMPRLTAHHYYRVAVDRRQGVVHQIVLCDWPSARLSAESVPVALHIGDTLGALESLRVNDGDVDRNGR
jgi:hypothetical protein